MVCVYIINYLDNKNCFKKYQFYVITLRAEEGPYFHTFSLEIFFYNMELLQKKIFCCRKTTHKCLRSTGFNKFRQEKSVVPWIGEQPYTEMLFWQFSNIFIYVKIIGKILDQHLSVWLFSNLGEKVQFLLKVQDRFIP